ncbi:MAG: NAD(P)H-dependent oxidoreductase [Muribaculaceae bacterium]|nr:NAD(P)H-dependent oxidoreductase [Muribaculaceae bacterium]
MKTLKMMMGVAAASMLVVAGSTKVEAQKVLVLYYSQTSNTKAVAECIANQLNADIEEIVAVNPYDGDFSATIERCKEEQKAGTTPKIKPIKADLSKYKTIFLGYPIWFGTYAPPVATWLDEVDLSGKTIVPFCTFGSGGLESSVAMLASKQPNAKILDGYGVRAARMKAMHMEVKEFLLGSGFLRGDFTAPGPFSVPHLVSDEEAAIFNAAIGDYPMMQNAKARTVASRTIPNGIEYLFTATEKPRRNPDPNLQMRPPKEMEVYVIVVNGQAPEFTKVVR